MAREFDGLTDRIDYTTIDGTLQQPQSFSALIYSNAVPTPDDEYILCQNRAAENPYSILYSLYRSNESKIRFIATSGAVALIRYSTASAFPNAEWFHLFVTWTGSTTYTNIHIYINNVEVSDTGTNGSGGLYVPTGKWSLGGASFGDTTCFNGGLASVGWWDRVLTEKERGIVFKTSPRFIMNGLRFAPDLIRNQRDLITGQAGTLDGTSVKEHPNVIQPCGVV